MHDYPSSSNRVRRVIAGNHDVRGNVTIAQCEVVSFKLIVVLGRELEDRRIPRDHGFHWGGEWGLASNNISI